ncbi:NUDIX hydrolase [Oceanivirga miroungae]|uniref:NUDIX hydrolase n=1 Tax=Oceanivirga miroungae TaxID=1130046 RepID=A0A6I8MCG8_9FUSO|nr:8-oxo-dGTP diphosphatase [Oceanivirga miroungae]VWL84809.1 NUDIX hydrolase [Oceanivirga miroungae]
MIRCDTVVYLEKNDEVLMLLRNKKKNDINEGKYIGVGGKIEKTETPYEGAIREVKEETGYTVNSLEYRGLLSFISNNDDIQYIFIFTSSDFSGNEIVCNEGTLEWVKKDKIMSLNIWEGDRYFLEKIVNNDYSPFMIKTIYENDKLVKRIIEI